MRLQPLLRSLLSVLVLSLLAPWAPPGAEAAAARPARGRDFPTILLVTVDTLRADHLSAYGYERSTSPEIDRLLASGARFAEARTPEPLTGPALCSMLNSRHPHNHGATRNGLSMRSGLTSLPGILGQGGYRTAAFVGNWTLRDELTGLGAYFQTYEEVFSRKRWMGLFNAEATGEDLTTASLEWLRSHRESERGRPAFLWVHYVEPHAPYRFQKEFASQLGLGGQENPSRRDRYDSEIAFVDHQVGRLLREARALGLGDRLMVLFAADHGESLGEHGYWGHGRHLYESSLAVPMGVSWPGRIDAGTTLRAPAMLLDLAPTVLGLLGLEVPEGFQGHDWSGTLLDGEREPVGRVTTFQAHRGAVHSGEEKQQRARERGLLEVAILKDGHKELLRLKGDWVHRRFGLASDPGERKNLLPEGERLSPELLAWFREVQTGLRSLRDLDSQDATLDAESIERLKALGYID